jgi:hypothetical protein
MTTGFALTTEGVVQRFNRILTPVATTETAFAFIFDPLGHSGSDPAICTKLAASGGAVPSTTYGTAPGEAFLDAQADSVSTLAACMEVMYTGTLVNRKGHIGVCQVAGHVAADIRSGSVPLTDLMAYCQHIPPVPSHTVELKWSPSIRNYTSQNFSNEASAPVNENQLMVVAVGVNPLDFIVKFTSVYEYVPKFALGLPAPRATKSIPPNAGETIVSTLDRMGVWWHNLGGAAAAAYRMGGAAYYAAGQVARTGIAYGAVAKQLAGAAVPLLALAG